MPDIRYVPTDLPEPPATPGGTPLIELPTAITQEYAIFDCGTFAPGLVHDPCQHSLLRVLCCRCAGCTNEIWWCGQEDDPANYYLGITEAQYLRFAAWLHTPPGLWVLALLVILALTTESLKAIGFIVWCFIALGTALLFLELEPLLR